MDETLFKGGKNSYDPSQGGHYGSRCIANLFLNNRKFAWHNNLIMYFSTWGYSWGEDPGHGIKPGNSYGNGDWDKNSSGGLCYNVFFLLSLFTEILLAAVTMILCFISGIDYSILGYMMQIFYLITEYIGIHKKIKCLITFSCVIRVLELLVAVIFIIFVFISYFCQESIYEDCQTFRYLVDTNILIWHLFEDWNYAFRTFIIISVYIHLALGILGTYIQIKALFALREIIVVWDIRYSIQYTYIYS